MDGLRFDAWSRALVAAHSRRGVLGLLAGVAGLGVADTAATARRRKGGNAPVAAQKQADTVTICHRTGSATHPVVQLAVDARAIPAHHAHGDTIAPDFRSDPENCGGCGIRCDDGNPCTIDRCVHGTCVSQDGGCDASCIGADICTAPVGGCGDNSLCLCATTVGGDPFCASGGKLCQECTAAAGCPRGLVCVQSPCCAIAGTTTACVGSCSL